MFTVAYVISKLTPFAAKESISDAETALKLVAWTIKPKTEQIESARKELKKLLAKHDVKIDGVTLAEIAQQGISVLTQFDLANKQASASTRNSTTPQRGSLTALKAVRLTAVISRHELLEGFALEEAFLNSRPLKSTNSTINPNHLFANQELPPVEPAPIASDVWDEQFIEDMSNPLTF